MSKRNKNTVAAAFGAACRARRIAAGYTLAEIADSVGCKLDAISKIERGDRTPPLDTAVAIAAALGVPLGELLAECSGVTDNSRQNHTA